LRNTDGKGLRNIKRSDSALVCLIAEEHSGFARIFPLTSWARWKSFSSASPSDISLARLTGGSVAGGMAGRYCRFVAPDRCPRSPLPKSPRNFGIFSRNRLATQGENTSASGNARDVVGKVFRGLVKIGAGLRCPFSYLGCLCMRKLKFPWHFHG